MKAKKKGEAGGPESERAGRSGAGQGGALLGEARVRLTSWACRRVMVRSGRFKR